jgi:hypothetical protein
MLKIVCDRCEKTIEGNYVLLEQRSTFEYLEDREIHLCYKCYTDFDKFLANKT